MIGQTIPHFVESGRINLKTGQARMPDLEYATALDYLVFTCVDIAFLCENHLLLARRKRYPRKDWWIIGGRMMAGESPLDTAQRKAWEEAKLPNLERDRFQYVGVYSTCFANREQPPQQNGSHSVNLTYQVRLTPQEQRQVLLTDLEYEPDYQWFNLSTVQELADPSNPLDQALLQVIHDLKRNQLL